MAGLVNLALPIGGRRLAARPAAPASSGLACPISAALCTETCPHGTVPECAVRQSGVGAMVLANTFAAALV